MGKQKYEVFLTKRFKPKEKTVMNPATIVDAYYSSFDGPTTYPEGDLVLEIEYCNSKLNRPTRKRTISFGPRVIERIFDKYDGDYPGDLIGRNVNGLSQKGRWKVRRPITVGVSYDPVRSKNDRYVSQLSNLEEGLKNTFEEPYWIRNVEKEIASWDDFFDNFAQELEENSYFSKVEQEINSWGNATDSYLQGSRGHDASKDEKLVEEIFSGKFVGVLRS